MYNFHKKQISDLCRSRVRFYCSFEVSSYYLYLDIKYLLTIKPRQHLKRTHIIPIKYHRYKENFLDQNALANHSRNETQCQVLPQQAVEGIPQHKWDMIKSCWGATWSDIYEIIFPGHTPIPSCCMFSTKSNLLG